MNSSKQREDLVYLIYSPTGSGVIGAVDSWGEGGKLKIASLQNQQPRLAPAKVGKFLGMVMCDNEFETKENNI